MKWLLAFSAALFIACAGDERQQVHTTPISAHSTEITYYVPTATVEAETPIAIIDQDPTATPTLPPTLAPTPTPELPTVAPPPIKPAAVATPVPAPAADTSTILGIIAQYDWPYDEAVAVAQCESGLNPNARNPSGATGLFQIIGGNPAMFDPHANAAAAYAKYQDGLRRGNRWYHWNAFGSCGHFY